MSWASSEGTRRSMLSNRARDTKPELAGRRALHARGFRYRVDMRPGTQGRRRADIVFTRQRIAVFIDGCFWHGCPIHATTPKTNADYWLPKLRRNVERDLEVTDSLVSLGWTVARFWEHEVPAEVVEWIAASLEIPPRDTPLQRTALTGILDQSSRHAHSPHSADENDFR